MDLITQTKNRLLTATGLLAGGSVCLALASAGVFAAIPGGGIVATILGTMVSAVTGGVVANDSIPEHLKQVSVRLRDSQQQLSNHDLTNAVGLAMGLIIKSVAESGNYPDSQKDLQRLAESTVKAWPKVAKRLKMRVDNTFEVLQDEAVSGLFSGTMEEFLNTPVLAEEDWRKLLQNWLCVEAQIWLRSDVLDVVINRLYEQFPLALREVLKADFKEGGKAFAGLTIAVLSEMQGSLQELLARPTGEDLGNLQTSLEQEIQSLAGLRQQLENNAEGFRELGEKMDSGFAEVLRELRVAEENIEGKVNTLRQWLQGYLAEIIERLDELKKGQKEIIGGIEEVSRNTEKLLDRLEGINQQKQARLGYVLDSNRPAISYWQGRVKELETVNGWLDDENRKLGFICGIGGVGKSALAAKIYETRSDFERKFWADLGDAPFLSALARKILQEFKIFDEEELEKMDEKNLGTVLINCLQKQRYLLILDNFESVLDDEDYQEFLQQWLGCFSQTEILVTTQAIPSLKQVPRTEITLQGLLAREGVEYLQAVGIGGEDEELSAFVTRVKGHPLTLKLVAGFLNEERGEGATIGDLQALGVHLLDERIDGNHRQQIVQLVTVLEASFQRLTERLQGVLLSVLVLRGGFDVAMARGISGEDLTEKELRDLQRRGLLIVTEKNEQKTNNKRQKFYEFQPLIEEYLKYKSGDLIEAHQRAISFYQGTLKPREEWETVEDVGEYLEIFHHWCELGEYETAFDSIYDGSYSDRCVAKFLDLRGYNQLRIELFTRLRRSSLSNPEDWRYDACLNSLGLAYSAIGEYREAIRYYKQKLAIQPKTERLQNKAAVLGNLGNAYHSLGEYQQAIAFHQQSLEIQRQIGDRRGEATSLNGLGNAYYSLGDYQQAIALHQQSLEIKRQIGDRRGEATSLIGLGNAYRSLGDYQQAIALHQQSLEIQRQIGNRGGEAASLGNLGNAYRSLGDYQQAIALYQQSLEIKRQIGNRGGEAASLNGLGNAYNSLGDYQQAIALHQQSLEIARQIGDRGGEATSLNNLGNAYYSLGDYQQAIALHQQSLEIQRQIGDRRGEADSLNNLGNAYDSLGEYQQAIALHQQSLEIKRQIGNRRGEADSLIGLGNAYQSLGDYQQAIAFYQQSLEIQRQIGDRQGEANSLNGLGNAYNSLGEYQQAIAFHQQSLEIKRQIGDRRGEARSLQNLGSLYHKVGRIQDGYVAVYQAQKIYQALDLPLNAYPLSKWMKAIAKFAQRSKFNLILCFILGLVAFPFALIWIILIALYRIIRNLFQ